MSSSRKAATVLTGAVSALVTIIFLRRCMRISYIKSKEPPCKLAKCNTHAYFYIIAATNTCMSVHTYLFSKNVLVCTKFNARLSCVSKQL